MKKIMKELDEYDSEDSVEFIEIQVPTNMKHKDSKKNLQKRKGLKDQNVKIVPTYKGI